MEITKREVLASISIIAMMLMIGAWLGGLISDACEDRNAVYNKAVKIESADLFKYGMQTNVGNAFVYGDLKAVDTVTYDEIGGEYMYVEKVKERYTRHTQTYTTTVNGKPRTRTRTYWSWDPVDREDKTCKEIAFLGVVFDSGKIKFPSDHHIETIKESSHVRCKYYVVDTEHVGTIFADLRDDTIPDGTKFYKDMTIDETVESLQSFNWTVVFWIFWIALTGGLVYGFYYLDNWWLE